jgi:hypothetical protein
MEKKDTPETRSLLETVPDRERRINIWKAEIEYYERIRRQNGASVIGVRAVPISSEFSRDFITDFLVDHMEYDELFTVFNDDISIIDCWGIDLIALIDKCESIRNDIPKASNNTKGFNLEFAIVGEIPFEEMHHQDTLELVLHRVLTLLNNIHGKSEIAHDYYPNMRKSAAQERRLDRYMDKMGLTEHKESDSLEEDDEDIHPLGGAASSVAGI